MTRDTVGGEPTSTPPTLNHLTAEEQTALDNKMREAEAADPICQSEMALMERLNYYSYRIYHFRIAVTEDGYWVADCRKTPPKVINSRPLKSLNKAIFFMAKRNREEYQERSDLWYEKTNGKQRYKSKWEKPKYF